MPIQRPSGGRKDEMTRPPAWPETDEDALRQRSDSLQHTQKQLRDVLDTWKSKKAAIFGNNTWFGDAATAAERMVDAEIQKLEALDQQLTAAINFYNEAYEVTVKAKNLIIEVTDAAQDQIDTLANDSANDGDDRSSEMQSIVDRAFSANSLAVSVAGTALGAPQPTPGKPRESTPGSSGETPRGIRGNNPMSNLLNNGVGLDQNNFEGGPSVVPPAVIPKPVGDVGLDSKKSGDQPPPPSPKIVETGYHGQDPGRVPNQPGVPANIPSPGATGGVNGPAPEPADPGAAAPGGGFIPGSGGGGQMSGGSTGGISGGSGAPTGGPSSPGGGQPGNQMADFKKDNPQGSTTPNADLTPAQQQQGLLNDFSKGIDQGTQAAQANPMTSPASATQLPVNPQVPVDPPAAPPPTAGPGATGAGAGLPGGGGLSGGGSGLAPIGGMSGPTPTPMPLGPPATPTPAAPVGGGSGGSVSGTPGSTPTGPGVHAASTANTSAAGVAAPAPIPVSAA
ncbi:MAG: hypothetical protein QOK33_80, partial [Mycobacterium sp.]|nr:hypothetical protein [Mycobacterium sp.]